MIKTIILKLLRLFVGFFVCATGIILMINASLGLSPWDVLHQGLSKNIGITMGTASVLIGASVVVLDMILGENIGWATVLNMIFIGVFMDIISFSNLIPVCTNFATGMIMLFIGMICVGFGTVMYMGCGLGSGPRDGLMVAIQKRTSKPIKLIRATIEVLALILGFVLGGSVGIGTVVTAVGLGYFLQVIFKMCNFDSSKIKHRFIVDDVRLVKSLIKEKNKNTAEKISNNN